MKRSPGCLEKRDRIIKAIRHEEPDRVPVSDMFWSSFVRRWRSEFGLPRDADIFSYYDLDWTVTIPNIDPHIKPFDVLKSTDDEVMVRTGFEAVIRKKHAYPMPEYVSFETDTIEKMRDFEFDDPWDERRYFQAGDNQIAGVGDEFQRNIPPWLDTLKARYPTIPVFGSVTEGHETLWRIIGPQNTLLWIGLYPDEVARFVNRINTFVVEMTKAQIKAADGLLDGMVVWGDVAHRQDLFFSPDYWRKHFKPGVKEIVDVCHAHGLPVLYHGCGNSKRIFQDFIDVGIDVYHPLEAKAGFDVVDMRARYGHRMAFCGNMDVQAWASASEEDLRRIVLTKLNAAKGGGYIFQSDHSVPDSVSPQRYDFVVRLVREHGNYPLALGEFDVPIVGDGGRVANT